MRTGVVAIFPNRACAIRRMGMILAVQDDEWQDGGFGPASGHERLRRTDCRPETMAAIDAVPLEDVSQPPLLAS